MATFHFLLFLSISTIVITADVDEQSVMSAFLKSLSPPPKGWSATKDHCSWPGVICNKFHNEFFNVVSLVTSIDLHSQSLSGTLPDSLNNLTQLTSLKLQNNRFSGPLPSLFHLYELTTVLLDHNNFTSVLPDAFSGLDSLTILSLSENSNLSPWSLPAELNSSYYLTQLYANLVGPLPDIFTSFPRLVDVRLSYNGLNGSLPGSLNGSLIQTFQVNNQRDGLSGTLEVVSGMTELKQVWLQANKFTGQIPDLSQCKVIFDLQLSDNQLTGVVPASVFSLAYLLNITLQNNKLLGPVPQFSDTVEKVNVGGTNSFCKNQPGDCDPQVNVMLIIEGDLRYPLLLADNWLGNDACSGWIGVTCDGDKNVVTINLTSKGFNGTISPAFVNLQYLKELYLGDNNLTGFIPPSLADLSYLVKVDVSNNNITGRSPFKTDNVSLITAGNPLFVVDVPAPEGTRGSGGNATRGELGEGKNGSVSTGMVAGVVISVVVVVGVVIFVLYKCHTKGRKVYIVQVAEMFGVSMKKRHGQSNRTMDDERWGDSFLALADMLRRFTYEELQTATNNFDNQKMLGQGGFGSVFKGILQNGTIKAVKRLDHFGQQYTKDFMAELKTTGSINHLNLVKLVGYCIEHSRLLFSYDYMSNGSLDSWIFHKNKREGLSWGTRKNVILHIAKGLAYLHEECQKKIIHLDVKPQNVLLDDSFNAKLADFGLATLIERDKSYAATRMRGTPGYLAPEWLEGKTTEKADVYSFGVVVLEVLFERKNVDDSLQDSDYVLIKMVRRKAETSQLHDLLDKCSEDMQQNGEDVERLMKLALWCLNIDATTRPSMSIVVKGLEGVLTADFMGAYYSSSGSMMVSEVPTTGSTDQLSEWVLSGPR